MQYYPLLFIFKRLSVVVPHVSTTLNNFFGFARVEYALEVTTSIFSDNLYLYYRLHYDCTKAGAGRMNRWHHGLGTFY